MTHPELFALAGAAIVAVGLHGLATRPHLLRKLIAVNLIGAGVFLILVALAARSPDGPDPVPHAMVLTGIVIAVSFTAFGVVLAVRLEGDGDEGDGKRDEAGPGDGPGPGSPGGPEDAGR